MAQRQRRPSKQPPAQEEVKEQPPQEKVEIPQEPQEGFGRFEYRNGTIYEGQWKIINGVKMKHGEGVLKHAGTTAHEQGNEEYRGSWQEDKMHGFGVYKYTSGAEYSGEWQNGKQHGRGVYEFPAGAIYEGEWKNHKMHGEGQFIDMNGKIWEGEFVEGVFQSKMQKYLKNEKILKKKEEQIHQNVVQFFGKFKQAFDISDKKTFKENLQPFFAISDEIKLFVKEPYPKYEERPPDKWNDVIQFIGANPKINILRQNLNSTMLNPEFILSSQFSGPGQVVEFSKQENERKVNLVLCNVFENTWVIVYLNESK